MIFSAQFPIPGEKRVENGITGTVVDADRDRDRVTIETHEREPREVQVDTDQFSDLSLGYAVHVYKAQGITAETSGILTGGWQTDREHAYVALSRAREQTQIYVAREDLGEQGMDIGAIERLGERMRRSGAQEASIAKNTIEPDGLQPDRIRQRTSRPRRPRERAADDDAIPIERDRGERDRAENATAGPAAHPLEAKGPAAISLNEAQPQDIKISTLDLGEIKLANSQTLYTVHSDTGQPTHILFGAWETDREQGYVVVTHTQERTDVHINVEERGEQNIEAELIDRIGAVIERSHAQEPTTADREANTAAREASTPGPEREREPDSPPQLEPAERDPYIDQAIQEAQDRQQAWERDSAQDRDNDRGFE